MTLPTPIAEIPWTSPEEIALSPFGVALELPNFVGGPLESICAKAADVRGTGISVLNDGRIRGSVSKHCYVGARLISSDSRITDSDLFNHRDVCLWIARDAGNCRSVGNQFYGSRIAIYNEAGEGYQSTADRVEDSLVGALCDAQSKFVGTFFQHNLVRCCVLRGGNCEMDSCEIRVQLATNEHPEFYDAYARDHNVPGLPSFSGTAGVEIVGNGARLRGCRTILDNWILRDKDGNLLNTPSGKPATGYIVAADDCEIDGDLTDADGLDGSVGIHVKGARKSVRIDCTVRGFDAPKDRVLTVDEACQLDITLRLASLKKPLKDYLDLPSGWTGSVRVIVGGATQVLPVGRGA